MALLPDLSTADRGCSKWLALVIPCTRVGLTDSALAQHSASHFGVPHHQRGSSSVAKLGKSLQGKCNRSVTGRGHAVKPSAESHWVVHRTATRRSPCSCPSLEKVNINSGKGGRWLMSMCALCFPLTPENAVMVLPLLLPQSGHLV